MSAYIADIDTQVILSEIRAAKRRIAAEEKKLEGFYQALYNKVNEHEQIITEDGEELATWAYSKDSEYFDAKAFKEKNEKLYNEYLKIRAGSRRLVLK